MLSLTVVPYVEMLEEFMIRMEWNLMHKIFDNLKQFLARWKELTIDNIV